MKSWGASRAPALAFFRLSRHHAAMARIAFTSNLQRHLSCPVVDAEGTTVRAVLDDVFTRNARLRSYILDDQDRLRRHVVLFINGSKITDRENLSDPVADNDEVFVFQALTGG